eukprot:Skav234546  [mRNA]  locus=scaffold2556:282070:283461:- [translate_table: standard]
MAESILLCNCSLYHVIMVCKDVKNGRFCGKTLGRQVYLEQPRGGLNATYGFAEAVRLYWLAFPEHLPSDGRIELSLEPVLFYHRGADGVLNGIPVTDVDDLGGGDRPGMQEQIFFKSSQALSFSANHRCNLTFRGREIKPAEVKDEDSTVRGGRMGVCMRNCALARSRIHVDKSCKEQLDADPEEEQRVLNSGAGWLREAIRKDGEEVRWIDGQQNMANVLTKANTDKSVLNQFLQDGFFSPVQTETNRRQKLQRQLQPQARRTKENDKECENSPVVPACSSSEPQPGHE